MSGGSQEGFGRCLEGVYKVSAGYLKSVGKGSGRCLEDIWNVSGGYLEYVSKVTGPPWSSIIMTSQE